MTEKGFKIIIYFAFLLVPMIMALYAAAYWLDVTASKNLLHAQIGFGAMLLAFAGGEYMGTLRYTFLDPPPLPAHESPLRDSSSLGLILLFLAFIALNNLAQSRTNLTMLALAHAFVIPGFILIMYIDRRLLHYKIQPTWFTRIRMYGCSIALAALAISGVKLYTQMLEVYVRG
ncbi:MAG: hypothetical protein ABFQ95_00475 [Pseudomonadota bacterium]